MKRNLLALSTVVVAAVVAACNQDRAPAPPSGPVPPTEVAVASLPEVAAPPAPAPAPVETGTPAPAPAKQAVREEPTPAPPPTTPRLEDHPRRGRGPPDDAVEKQVDADVTARPPGSCRAMGMLAADALLSARHSADSRCLPSSRTAHPLRSRPSGDENVRGVRRARGAAADLRVLPRGVRPLEHADRGWQLSLVLDDAGVRGDVLLRAGSLGPPGPDRRAPAPRQRMLPESRADGARPRAASCPA